MLVSIINTLWHRYFWNLIIIVNAERLAETRNIIKRDNLNPQQEIKQLSKYLCIYFNFKSLGMQLEAATGGILLKKLFLKVS